MLQVAGILDESVVDGVGIRVVVFFQGCCHMCEGCHNPDLLPFEGGTFYTVEQLGDELLKKLTGLHRGITFSGGDPFFQQEELNALIDYLRERKPEINIWAYTGFKYEAVCELPLMQGIDVLVDGRFEEEYKDLLLRFRGSSNQRLIDVKASLREKRIIQLDI